MMLKMDISESSFQVLSFTIEILYGSDVLVDYYISLMYQENNKQRTIDLI